MAESIRNLRTSVIWNPADGYANHRIPGVMVTSRGTVLVYCEARRSASDWALMDVLMQRSDDCGENFGPPILLASGDEQHPTVNNPVMMEDVNGRLHLLYCRDYTIRQGGAWRRYSDDDGLSWSAPQEIPLPPEMHNAFAFGPGHGVRLTNGVLLVPVWMVLREAGVAENAHIPSVLHTLYSADNGETWQLGERVETGLVSPNETVAAQLPDGRVALTIRSMATRRSLAFSPSGTADWSVPVAPTALPDPRCFGSMICLEGTLVHVNCACETERKNVTLKASTDGGSTWRVLQVIDPDQGGYCDLAADSAYVYVLYEHDFGREVLLARLKRSELHL